MSGGEAIRIDRLLYFLRITKTRSMAQRILAEGHVRLDGQPIAKSNTTMRVGQVLTLPVHDQVRVVRVISLPHRRGPAVEAQSCYDDLSPNFPAASD